MAKALFLDIDGVLNSNFWNDSHQREISDGTLVDEEKVKMLALLVKRTNAKTILHSGWRFWFDDELKPLGTEAEKLVEVLAKEDLFIDGVTPDLTTEEIKRTKKFSLVKADEILLWLKLHNDITGWVVLDDLDLHSVQIEQHQVKTDPTIGLTLEDIEKAEKILEENYLNAYEKHKTERGLKRIHELKMLTSADHMWNKVRDYAKSCSWSAGKSLANAMDNNLFTEWERVIVALDDQKICGYCTVAKTDCIPDVCYTPYIGYMFVDEEYRGNRLSQKLIQYSVDYLKTIGFDKVHIVSDHENLYEKYGFEIIDRKTAPWGSVEKIYMQRLV